MAFTAIRKRKSRIFEREKCKNTQKNIYITQWMLPTFWRADLQEKNRSMYTRAIIPLDLYPKTVTRNRQMFKKSQGGEKVVKN